MLRPLGKRYRLMESVTDELGRTTGYTFDADGNRTGEYVYPPGVPFQSSNHEVGAIRATEFKYEDAHFDAFLSERIVKKIAGWPDEPTAWSPPEMVARSTADNLGRVVTETVDPGGLDLKTTYARGGSSKRSQWDD